MSLQITSITRQSTAPCNHFLITVNDNGTTRSKAFSLSELDTIFDRFESFPGGARGALLLAWAIDRRARGATNTQLLNVEIESVI